MYIVYYVTKPQKIRMLKPAPFKIIWRTWLCYPFGSLILYTN